MEYYGKLSNMRFKKGGDKTVQSLKEKVDNLKNKLQELAKIAKTTERSGRDSEIADQLPQADLGNWNKGWGKYGKT